MVCIRMLGVRIALIAGLVLASLFTQISVINSPDDVQASDEDGPTFRIYAHREGLVGHTTANGHVIQENDHFVALPCFCALSSKGGDEFKVKIEYEGRTTIAPVWDVGPWNVNDNYWDHPEDREWPGLPRGVPQAQAAYQDGYNGGLDGWDRVVRSQAGIDIADGTFWNDLGMVESDWVNVTFLWLDDEEEGRREARIAELQPLPEGYEHLPTVFPGETPPIEPVEPSERDDFYFFKETGHNVPEHFYNHWWDKGGWRAFGMPITELFREVESDGSERIVQHFERTILELNLPPSDRPLVQGALVGKTAEAPAEARVPIEPFVANRRARYFDKTGHSLQNGFLSQWNAHGGLEVFGYPITEEFLTHTPDGRPYVAQLFERSRFEWWPDKVGTDEEFAYGRLVSEMHHRGEY